MRRVAFALLAFSCAIPSFAQAPHLRPALGALRLGDYVQAIDAFTFVVMSSVMVVVALVASYVPARRASATRHLILKR